jgi:ABC-type transport system involved in multi-copper enzyme maturation permease subunit
VSLSRRRVLAIARKELAEYRRNRSLVASIAVTPLVFIIQPLISVIALGQSASGALTHEHVLLYMLGIPVLVPVVIAAYAVAGERQQETLEPALTTPIRAEEFLLGKALAAFGPSVVIAYAVYVIYLALVALMAQPGVAAALIQGPDLVAQLLFTPLFAIWSIWVGFGVSVRVSDLRVAQQVGLLASLPPVFVILIVALNIVPPSPVLAIAGGVLLLVLDLAGWRFTARLFDRERLITGTR